MLTAYGWNSGQVSKSHPLFQILEMNFELGCQIVLIFRGLRPSEQLLSRFNLAFVETLAIVIAHARKVSNRPAARSDRTAIR